jgi:hypothetical protein
MTATAKDIISPRLGSDGDLQPPILAYPVKAATRINGGSIVATDTSGRAVPASADASLRVRGRARVAADNTAVGAADGDVTVEIEAGCFFYTNGDSITAADIGKMLYAIDDQTVAKSSSGGTRPKVGELIQMPDSGSGKVAVLVGMPTLYPKSLGAGVALTDTATQTIQITGGNWRTIPTLGQGGTLTVGTTGAVAGDELTITRTSTDAQTYAIVNGGTGAGTLVTMPNSKINFADIQFDGTNWALKRTGAQ